jgi:cellulose synthase/poly-beta-1,6-N-acetylglucosamine synthase-like glycosyltransferase
MLYFQANMSSNRISLIVTTYNEEKTIGKLIDSIAKQSKIPSEIIVVDGGSNDRTIEVLEKKLKTYKNKLYIKIINKIGNRSVGRNEAVNKASGDIILCTDAGCILDKDWIKNITKPFEDKSVDVVAGYYKGLSKNIFQKSLIPYVLVMEDRINNDFLPATRSMAFKKYAWKKVNGFNEKLSHNEDYDFANNLKKSKLKIVFAKNAIVYWVPRKNLKEAFIMFFRFALGDVQANLLRDKVIYIFLRYIFAGYLIILSFIERSVYLYLFIALCFLGYVLWSIWKNYKYVVDLKAIFYLPILQFLSDLAVLFGTIAGLVQRLSLKSLFRLILSNKGVTVVIVVYILSMLSVITYGIPGPNHPFDYFMDEWHQSQSVRNLFKYGTPNIAGSANGSIFQFFLTGLYLIPFYLLGIVNPFAIKSSVINLDVQYRLFEVLRLNTLFFGILSIILVTYISKKYFKANSFVVSFLFVFNPIWITLSNYFKYDIALMFWMLLSFLFTLRYVKNNKFMDFIFTGIFSSLALATKLEPFNLLIIYILIFFTFTVNFYKKFKYLYYGLAIYIIVFLAFGIPDILLGKGDLNLYLSTNLSSTPEAISNNLNLGVNYLQYFLEKLYPVSFGRIFYFGFLILALTWIIYLFSFFFLRKINFKKILLENKYLIVLLISFITYSLSLVPLRTGALANRLVPLLPLMALMSVLAGEMIYKKIKTTKVKYLFLVLVCFLLAFQFAEAISWNTLKNNNDPRYVSSNWISHNIKPGTVIGIENIPIYQTIPDIILKEFYLKEYGKAKGNTFEYKIISGKDIRYPNVVIITNDFVEQNYLIKSDKKEIVFKLKKQKYKKIKVFNLKSKYFYFFNDRLNYYMSALIQAPDTISIYEKK